ncbi:MAG: hypothetical protein ACLQBB_16010 [Solirubrobacteraceae bacterium]
MRSVPLTLAALLLALSLGGCGNTLQDKPIPHNILEGMIVAPFPVYWLGDHFQTLAITEASHDVSGAFTVQYGNCLQGGQGTCTPPLRVVTAPDNSFLPGASNTGRATLIRGAPALVSEEGRAIVIPTGPVVVDIYADNTPTALAAARAIAPINRPGVPGGALQAPLPDTGYDSMPLPSQRPNPVAPLG